MNFNIFNDCYVHPQNDEKHRRCRIDISGPSKDFPGIKVEICDGVRTRGYFDKYGKYHVSESQQKYVDRLEDNDKVNALEYIQAETTYFEEKLSSVGGYQKVVTDAYTEWEDKLEKEKRPNLKEKYAIELAQLSRLLEEAYQEAMDVEPLRDTPAQKKDELNMH